VWGGDTSGSTAAFSVINAASSTLFQIGDDGNGTMLGTLVQGSDQRLKTNIQSLDGTTTLEDVMNLNPVTFNWINPAQGTSQQVGFIAQQVQQVFPQLVSLAPATPLTPGGTLSVNYSGLIAPAIEAIKELAIEVQGFSQAITTNVLNATTVKTQDLCIGSTCVTEDQLKVLLQQSGQSSAVIQTPTPTPPSDDTSSTTSDSDTSTPSDDSSADSDASSTPDTSDTSTTTPDPSSTDTGTTSSDTSSDNSSSDSASTTPASP
jgi:hypothetical protein